MKRIATMVIASGLFVSLLSGCGSSYKYEEVQLKAVVTACQQGDFHPDDTYLSTASSYLAQQDYGMYNMYMALAQTNGKYDYILTVDVDGKKYDVVREEEIPTGTEITVTQVNKYDDESLIETDYK